MSPALRKTIYAFIIAATLLTLYLIFDSVTDRVTDAERNTARTNEALKQANGKVTALGRQVRGLGEAPVVSTAPVEGPQLVQGPAGAAGQPGVNGQTGTSGVPGADGQNGAAGQPGASGAAGPAGPAGAKGDTGATGPAGKDGADGKDGTNGQDGRGIASFTCTSLTPFDITLTYTDGSTDTQTCGGGG